MLILKKFSKFVIMLTLVIGCVAVMPVMLAHLGFWEKAHAGLGVGESSTNENKVTSAGFAEAVERAAPAVVSINTAKEMSAEAHPLFRDPFFRHFFGEQMPGMPLPKEQLGLGSGVIVDNKGYVLTNNHVIQGATDITVKLHDGREVKAKLIGNDPETDLAVLKVNLGDLPVIIMGKAEDKRVGDIVLAIGNPFGVGQTVTLGIISALRRSDLGLNTFENFIQTDASINPGNSGGALIDSNGQLIGINTAIYTNSGGSLGIGFAIPIELAKEVMTQLIQQGHVTRGFMGISIAPLNEEFRKQLHYPKGEGVVVTAIVRGGPADKAGIRPGDIITKIDNKSTPNHGALLGITTELTPNQPYAVEVVRNNTVMEFRVVITQRPVEKPKPVAEEGGQ